MFSRGALVAVTAAVLVGCAGSPVAHGPGQELFDGRDPHERFVYERDPGQGQKPSLGLVLSGGGTKAAVFAHGVLHGLADRKILDQVDVISSTSGGGYAAYWYFSKRLDVIRHPKDYPGGYGAIFRDCFPAWIAAADNPQQQKLVQIARQSSVVEEVCDDPSHLSRKFPGQDPYRWQAHLLRWPDVFKPGIAMPTENIHPYWNQAVNVLASLIEGPISLLGGHKDSYTAYSYQYGIERAWGLNPLPRDPARQSPHEENWEYNNAVDDDPRWTRKLTHVDPAKMSWAELRDAYRTQKKFPLWILNTTQGQKDDRKPDPANLFEITPFGYGSPRWGYFTATLPPLQSIAQGVRASAAFADSQGLGKAKEIKLVRTLARIFPAASWGVNIELPDKTGVRLSDGGGADDLALVSAVRRGLDDIIIVDTASDGAGIMDDLCWSRNLLGQAGFTMTFPALQKLDDVCASLFEDKPVRLVYNVSAWMNPVVKGTLQWPGSGRVTRLWLIKAAWDEQAVRRAFEDGRCGFGLEDVNCLLAIFWGSQKHRDGQYLSFPQHGTAGLTLDGSASLTLAYRELGRMLASHLQWNAASNGLGLVKDTQCQQPAHPVREGKHRPEDRPVDRDVPRC